VVNRGAAIHGDKIIFATLDAHLIALNRHTGKVLWNKTTSDYQAGYSATAAPLIVKDMVITGNSGGEFGIIGEVQARNVDTGELIWSRPTIEGHIGTLKGQPNGMTGKLNATWQGDMYKTGGGATWLGGTYDPETNLLFFGTGNPGPWNSHLRPGDNLYTSSTLAIDPDTGVIKWHYQTTPHDGWDFDGVNEFIPFDATINGKPMKLGAKADRNGYFYVLDRTNGKLLGAHKFVMQTTWADGINLKTGRPNYTADGRPGAPAAPKRARSCSPRRPSLAARTGCRWPIRRTRACSMCPPTTGAWTSGTNPSPIRRARPIWAPVLPSSRLPKTTSARCARWTRPPARSCGNTRTRPRCGAAF
jgi:alcohol dehydrogenase (cytochrome c)